VKLSALAGILGVSLPPGTADPDIDGIAAPAGATDRHISFLSSNEYAAAVAASSCVAVIVGRGVSVPGKITLETDDPYLGYARAAQAFEDTRPVWGPGIAESAVVDGSAIVHPSSSVGPRTVIGHAVTVGRSCRIGALCVIEPGTTIGDQCRIDSGAVIRAGTKIGNRVIIQSGAVIGSDGFGNAREKNGTFVRIPCFGNVVIDDDADIGACVTIDRGNLGPTIIGKGVKIDNLVQIAHNVEIGDDTAIASQTGISGSTRVGKRVLIGGQAGFVGHIEIGDDSFVGAKAGVSKDVAPGAKITGYPARDFMTMRRIEAASGELPELVKEVRRLRREVETLKQKHID